jgi:hypothetical protein
MKNISFIGNPLEWDVRANYQYIVANVFNNLESMNTISTNNHTIEEMKDKF